MRTHVRKDIYNVGIAREFKILYGDYVKFRNGNFYVCIDGKQKIDEHNVYTTYAITGQYFEDISFYFLFLNKIQETLSSKDPNLIQLHGVIKNCHAVKEKIQGGFV